jgi:uncharacterized protein DUF29
MSDLYDTDVVTWAEQQAALLRRLAHGQRINATPDWANIAEQIEDVGISEINAALSQIDNILRHRIYLLGWPEVSSVRKWQVELHDFQRQLRRHYRPSMTTGGKPRVTDAVVHESYGEAVEYCRAHMDTDPTQPLPKACPWTLADLLVEQ